VEARLDVGLLADRRSGGERRERDEQCRSPHRRRAR